MFELTALNIIDTLTVQGFPAEVILAAVQAAAEANLSEMDAALTAEEENAYYDALAAECDPPRPRRARAVLKSARKGVFFCL